MKRIDDLPACHLAMLCKDFIVLPCSCDDTAKFTTSFDKIETALNPAQIHVQKAYLLLLFESRESNIIINKLI